MGIVDRGADLSWISQYPFEQEVVFPPLCALEVSKINVEDGGLVVCLGIKVNPAHAQIEQVVAKMKNSHLTLLELLGDDLLVAGAPKALLAPQPTRIRTRDRLQPKHTTSQIPGF